MVLPAHDACPTENVAAAKWKPVLVNREARAALKDAGLIGETGPLLKLLDLDDIDVTDDGDVEGLDEQIADLQRQYGALFRKKRGGSAIDASDRGRDSGKKKSASEIQAEALRGGA